MTAFKKNITANYFGQGWSALMGLIFIPAYIKLLGIEAYGLIGLFAVIQAWMTLLDMGMSTTINRETASLDENDSNSSLRLLNILRSFEWICFFLSLAIILIVWLTASKVASFWLKADHIPIETITDSFKVIGFVVATRLWEELYKGAIRGLQHHVWLNIVQAILASLRWAGALLMLTIYTPSLENFFKWQLFISAISLLSFAYKTYSLLPGNFNSGKFSRSTVAELRQFAGGMALITLLSLFLTQIDKLILSGILSLEEFGYYSVASIVATSLMQLIMPMNAAVYPKLTELVSTGKQEQLIKTYHDSCQLLSCIIIPVALILSVFAKHVLFIWSGDQALTLHAAPILSVMVIGTLFNGFMNIPYMLQLAHGWTSYAVRVNLVAVAFIIPATLWIGPNYGAIGAAWIWAVLNISYVLIGVHFMYRRLLPYQKWHWYKTSIAKPLATGLIMSLILYYVIEFPEDRFVSALILTFNFFCITLSVILSIPNFRKKIFYK